MSKVCGIDIIQHLILSKSDSITITSNDSIHIHMANTHINNTVSSRYPPYKPHFVQPFPQITLY